MSQLLKTVSTVILLSGLAVSAYGQKAITAEKLSEQNIRELIQIKPEDFKCVDAHEAGFGRQVPAIISFQPMVGDTGWSWNKITDYDQRLTRIETFSMVIGKDKTCADFVAELPRRNGYFEFHREVWGQGSETRNGQGLTNGIITEVVTLKIKPGIELIGRNQWVDWTIPTETWNPEIEFGSGLLNEFAKHENDLQISGQGTGGFTCKAVQGRAEMVYQLHRLENTNARELRRAYANVDDCWDALTTVTQQLEAQGRTWLSLDHKAHRVVWTSFRKLVTGCDSIRVERLETEIEGLKFVNTSFIPYQLGSSSCPKN